jgi:hypothetical protein
MCNIIQPSHDNLTQLQASHSSVHSTAASVSCVASVLQSVTVQSYHMPMFVSIWQILDYCLSQWLSDYQIWLLHALKHEKRDSIIYAQNKYLHPVRLHEEPRLPSSINSSSIHGLCHVKGRQCVMYYIWKISNGILHHAFVIAAMLSSDMESYNDMDGIIFFVFNINWLPYLFIYILLIRKTNVCIRYST